MPKPAPKPAAEQKKSFEALLATSLEEECSMEVVQTVHDQLCQCIELHKESKEKEPLLISKEQVKTALRTVYANSREEQLTFDRVFDGFFISEEAMRQQAKEQMQKEQEMAQARAEADRELEQIPMHFSREQRDAYAAMSEEEQLALLATDGMLVKRPILVGDDFVLTGFRQAEWEEKLT